MKNKKIFFVGDSYSDKKISFDEKIVEICSNHSLCVFNFEGSITYEKKKIMKAGPHLQIIPENFDDLFKNFNLAILANNHIMDYGIEGLISTKKYCDEKSISCIGAGINIDKAFKTFQHDAYEILAVAENEFGGATEIYPGIATTENKRLIFEKINSIKNKNKKVIIVSHGGTELLEFPPPYIKELYKQWIDFGADLIIGNHPHVAQGVERYRNKTICYSLGNFIFIRNNYNLEENNTWSIGISYQYEDEKIEIIPISFNTDGIISAHNYEKFSKKINLLNEKITSPNYNNMYASCATKLYTTWYDRFIPSSKQDAAMLLHYFRCDAHRNLISCALSNIIGEKANKTIGSNSLKKINTEDDIKKMIQMSTNEQNFLRKIIEGRNNYLELGSGYSTVYFHKFVKNFISIETRKKWYENIKKIINKMNINNISLHLYEPEKCAYDEDGSEKWTNRNTDTRKSDYGLPCEFIGYINGVKKIVEDNNIDVILVDGNVRKEIIQMLISKNYSGEILLHDVTKEREYLNYEILTNKRISIVNKCESLFHLNVIQENI